MRARSMQCQRVRQCTGVPRRTAFALCGALTACAAATPPFSQEVAADFASSDMRKLVTPDLELYYPAQHREAAERLAGRASECLTKLRALQKTQRPRPRALLFLTAANFNNAYVSGQFAGEPLHAVTPLFMTAEVFAKLGFGNADTGDITCHELFHFAHAEQVENLWRLVNAAFGPVIPSQYGLERWFTEGVAQYYEGRLGRRAGRPSSPLYRGVFEAFAASRRGRLGPGDLSLAQRELSAFSGAYLTSLHFVEYLVGTYGEDSLWQVMDLQARSLFSPFGVTLRFRSVFGKSIGALIDDYSVHLARTLPSRHRPEHQRVLRAELGQSARLAAHAATGTLALFTTGNDEGPRLRILDRNGLARVERTLVELRPTREWIRAHPESMSGLTFSPDGRFLFLIHDDYGPGSESRSQLWKVDSSTGEVVRVWRDLGFLGGGALRPAGTAYTAVRYAPGHCELVDISLDDGSTTRVLPLSVGSSAAWLDWSPDGRRLVFSRFDGEGWNLTLLDADGQLRPLTRDDAFNAQARWVSATQVIFNRASHGRLQVHRLDVDSGRLEVLTNAPWTLQDPSPLPDGIAFLNAEGNGWTLDAASLTGGAVLREAFEPSAQDPSPAAPADDQAPPAPAPPPLVVEADEPYRSTEHLFIPQLRLPLVLVGLSPTFAPELVVSASLSGHDRLGFHSWALNAAFVYPRTETSASLAYSNMQLAPWQVGARASRLGFVDEAYWSASMGVSRLIYVQPVGLSFDFLAHQPFDAPMRRFLGPTLAASYQAGEGTPYGGPQRLLALDLRASAYPRGLGSSIDMLDLGATLAIAVPPPIRRSSLVATLTARALPGAPEGALRVGGVALGALGYLSRSRSQSEAGPSLLYLPGSLVEPVRGYEDYAVRATAAGIGTLRSRYHFVIDRGSASIVYLLPSLFFRQVDVDLFGTAAVTNHETEPWKRAVGGQVALRFLLGDLIALSLSYQFAWRFDLPYGPLHAAFLGFD